MGASAMTIAQTVARPEQKRLASLIPRILIVGNLRSETNFVRESAELGAVLRRNSGDRADYNRSMSNPPPHSGRTPFVQFSLGSALLMMTWAGLICVGLTSKAQLWPNIMGLLIVLALSTAMLVAIYGEGQSRAFAVGFALFGFLFLVCLHRFDSYSPRLLARYIGEVGFQAKNKEEWTPIASTIAARTTAAQRLVEERNRFVEVSQSTGVILAAAFGGMLARYINGKRQRTDAP